MAGATASSSMSSKTSLDKSKIKFLLLEGIHPSAVEVLHAAGYTNVESLPGALSDERSRPRSPTCTSSASARAPS